MEPIIQSAAKTENSRSRYSFASLCLGIVSILPVFGILFSILAMIFGFLGLNEVKRENKTGKGLAIVGIILSIVFGLANAGVVYYSVRLGNSTLDEYKQTPEYQQKIQQTQETVVSALVGVIERYKIDVGTYPASIEDLKKTDSLKNRPNLDKSIRYTRASNGKGYTLIYTGLDGLFGTKDDIRIEK